MASDPLKDCPERLRGGKLAETTVLASIDAARLISSRSKLHFLADDVHSWQELPLRQGKGWSLRRGDAMAFESLAHPIIYTRPERLHGLSTWSGHIPFAYLLLDLLKPRTFVELGTQAGVSYSAFCQGVGLLGLQTRCTAIDTWSGDGHTGAYGAEILAEFKQHHDPRFASFSRLLQAEFDSAALEFADGSIDLLHIDGFHTYQAVRHDFETYQPKLSPGAVVIFHDSAMRGREFGVHQLVGELAVRYPLFEFMHSYGLAVALVGASVPEPMVEFVAAAKASPEAYRGLFSSLGDHWETLTVMNQLIGVQFREMHAINAFKARTGSPIRPETQRLDVASSQPVSFAAHALQELVSILNLIKIQKS